MANQGLRNSLRFTVKPEFKDKMNLRAIVVDVLMDFLGVPVRDIMCLQDFPQQHIYDVTFVSSEARWKSMKLQENQKMKR